MTTQTPTLNQQADTKQKFHQLARREFPEVGEPGTVWVLTEVLGWSWDDIRNTCIDGFGREGYRRFILDEDGKKIFDKQSDETLKVTRTWTKNEKSKLKDWWWLLGY